MFSMDEKLMRATVCALRVRPMKDVCSKASFTFRSVVPRRHCQETHVYHNAHAAGGGAAVSTCRAACSSIRTAWANSYILAFPNRAGGFVLRSGSYSGYGLLFLLKLVLSGHAAPGYGPDGSPY